LRFGCDAASQFVTEGVVKFGEWVQKLISKDSTTPNDNSIPWLEPLRPLIDEWFPFRKDFEAAQAAKSKGPMSKDTNQSSTNDSADMLLTTPAQETKKSQEEVKAAQETIKSSSTNLAPMDPDLKALIDNTFALNQLTMAMRGIRFVAVGRT